MATEENARWRKNIRLGMKVEIVQKRNQPTGITTEGIVRWILTSKDYHSYGIKVLIDDRKVGRVQKILSPPEWEIVTHEMRNI